MSIIPDVFNEPFFVAASLTPSVVRLPNPPISRKFALGKVLIARCEYVRREEVIAVGVTHSTSSVVHCIDE